MSVDAAPEIDFDGPPHPVQIKGGLRCPNCDWDLMALPVRIKYDLKFVASLLGIKEGALRNYINRHPDEFPPRYRLRFNKQRVHRLRVLYAEEVQLLDRRHTAT